MRSGAAEQPEQSTVGRPTGSGSARVAVALGLASLALYAPALGFELVAFDDLKYLPRNPHLRDGLSLEALAWAFRSDYFSNWHPLTWISYLVDLELFGPSAAGHHFVNILLHAASAALLGFGLSRATGRAGASFFAAGLWALHPLRVESVAWVSQRKDVLALAIGLLAIGAYLRFAQRGGLARYALTAALLAAGLMAKPVLVTLPLLFLLLDHWPLGRDRAAPAGARARRIAKLWAEKLPLFALSLVSAAITLAVQRGAQAASPEQEIPLLLRLANAVYSLARTLAKVLWPADLSAYYLHPYLPGGEAPGPWLVVAVAGLAGATALAWRFRSSGHAWVGWLWFGIALLPNLGLVQVGMQGMADRYSYLPSIGLCTALGFGAADVAARWLPPRAARAGAALLLAALAAASARQLETWRSTESLFRHALEIEPRNWFAHAHLAELWLEAGRTQLAAEHLRATLAEVPYLEQYWYALGIAEARGGQRAAAIEAQQRAVALAPGHMKAQRALANLLTQEGQPAAALAHRQAAVAAAPRNPKVRLELGLALLESGARAAGRAELERARDRSVELGDRETAERAARALGRSAAPAGPRGEPAPAPDQSSR